MANNLLYANEHFVKLGDERKKGTFTGVRSEYGGSFRHPSNRGTPGMGSAPATGIPLREILRDKIEERAGGAHHALWWLRVRTRERADGDGDVYVDDLLQLLYHYNVPGCSMEECQREWEQFVRRVLPEGRAPVMTALRRIAPELYPAAPDDTAQRELSY
ncbi:unnamed protein product [Pedinophyceae sp. YPF-701]|nr:unnamed protein product [Pedinophyceae sp. YPF-701]